MCLKRQITARPAEESQRLTVDMINYDMLGKFRMLLNTGFVLHALLPFKVWVSKILKALFSKDAFNCSKGSSKTFFIIII